MPVIHKIEINDRLSRYGIDALSGASIEGLWITPFEIHKALEWRKELEQRIINASRVSSTKGGSVLYKDSSGDFIVYGEYIHPRAVSITDVISVQELNQMFELLSEIITPEVYDALMQRVHVISSGHFLESSLVLTQIGYRNAAGLYEPLWVSDEERFVGLVTLFRTEFVASQRIEILIHELLHEISTSTHGRILKSGVELSHSKTGTLVGWPRNEAVTDLIQQSLLEGDAEILVNYPDIINAYFSRNLKDILNVWDALANLTF